MSNDLLKQIDDLVASKTFNLDAIDSIKKLKDDLAKQLSETELFKKQLEKSQKDNSDLREECQKRLEHISLLQKKLDESEAYRAKAREDIYEAEKHKAVAEAWKEAMQTVFKPSSVRETMWQSIPISQTYNGNTAVSAYQQEIKTTKEEL